MAYKRISPTPIIEGGTNATSMTTTDGVVYYDGTRLVTTAVGTATNVLTSNGAGLAPTFQSAGGGGGITTINTDSGSVTGATVSLFAQGSSVSAGSTCEFIVVGGFPTEMQFRTSDNNGNTIIGLNTGTFPSPGTDNTGLGVGVLASSLNTSLGNCAFGNSSLGQLTSGSGNCSMGNQSMFSLDTGTNNIAIGDSSMSQATGASSNVAIGSNALSSILTSSDNIAIGVNALSFVDNVSNVAIGSNTLASLSTGSNNVGVGHNISVNLDSGTDNVLIGKNAGSAYSGAESSNIIIGSSIAGTNGESFVCRIGSATGGAGAGSLEETHICGIQGITVTGTAVLVSSTDQLGVAISSRRFKENISDMPSMTTSLMSLRPRLFNYTVGTDRSIQYGLIAEEVQEIMPNLVVIDKEGLPQTVKYHDLPVLLLKEIQELRKEVDELKRRIQ